MENQKGEYDSIHFRNIVVFSLGFALLMAAWLTTAAIEQTLLQSVKIDDPSFTGDGYISQAIVNGMFSLTNFIAPAIVTTIGVRTSLTLGTCFYMIFISNFLYPNSWFLYVSSVLIGFGAANVWVANGIYFTRNSRKETIGKYAGLYWAIMSVGQLSGNAFVFWKFQGMNHIDHDTRFLVTTILFGLAVLAAVTFMCLGKPPINKDEQKEEGRNTNKSVLASITQPFRLLSNKHMLLLIPPAMYNGVEVAFFTALYPTAVAFSEAFGGDTRKLVGFAGILIGAGSVTGGLVISILVERCKFVKSKRTCIVMISCLAHCTSCLLMYVNLANDAPLGPTLDISWINPPSIPIAMLCAFLIGLGDGCISPQMCAAIGVIWPDDPSSAHAIYRFFQAATCAIGYFIGTVTGLYNQAIVFVAIALFGTISFRFNETLIAKSDEYSVESVIEQIAVGERKMSQGLELKKETKLEE